MATSDEIKARIDIVDLVSQHVPLQKSGRSFKALCPFHAERTPSFFVFPERQTWRCFGACATGGDVFTFFMRFNNVTFVEAMRQLAQRAGIPLTSKTRRAEETGLYAINEVACQFFQERLASNEGKACREYLKKRGLNQQSISVFQLGLAPSTGDALVRNMALRGYTVQQLVAVGLVTQTGPDVYQDLFRGRLMFPIRDVQGQLVGFGGRALDDATPKYLNSPKTPLFDKGRILYGLHLARENIREKGAVVVEGYMDVIVAHQYGFANVVTSMGTALTEYQASMLRGLAPQVVLALDPDAAGQEATFRSLESAWNVFQRQVITRSGGQMLYRRPEGPLLKIAALPLGKDPDEVILEDPKRWEALITSAKHLMDYLFDTMSARIDLNTPEGKAQAAQLLFPLVAAIEEPFRQEKYFHNLASMLQVSPAALEASLGRPVRAGYKPAPSSLLRQPRYARTSGVNASASQVPAASRREASATPFATLQHNPLEEHLLALLLQNPQLKEEVQDLTQEHLSKPENRELFTWLLHCDTIEMLRDTLDAELLEHLDRILLTPLPPAEQAKQRQDLRQCLRRLKERRLRELKQEEALRLAQATEDELEQEKDNVLAINESIRKLFTDEDGR